MKEIENINLNSENKNKAETEEKKTGKYKITEFKGPIVLPENYSTDDEDEYNAIQIINQDISQWKLQKDKDNIKIYSKLFKIINNEGKEVDNITFYIDATINYPASEVNQQLHNLKIKSKWDSSLKKGKIIKEDHFPNNIDINDYYILIKMPLVFSNRDTVLRSKTWNNHLGKKECFLTHTKSIEHIDYPQKKKIVRAFYQNMGEYIMPINENKSKLYSIAKFDFKISVPTFLMETTGSEEQLKAIKELVNHCGKK